MEQNKVTENVAANPQENANGQKSFLDLGAIYTTVEVVRSFTHHLLGSCSHLPALYNSNVPSYG